MSSLKQKLKVLENCSTRAARSIHAGMMSLATSMLVTCTHSRTHFDHRTHLVAECEAAAAAQTVTLACIFRMCAHILLHILLQMCARILL